MHSEDDTSGRRLKIRIFVLSVCLTGLLLPSVLGLLVRAVLASRGVNVISLSQGATWMAPLTLLFLIPFLLFALLVKRVMRCTLSPAPCRYRVRLYVLAGAFAGMTATLAYLLTAWLQTAEGIGMVVAMAAITGPIVLFLAVCGALAGAGLGWLVWRVRGR